MTDYTGTEAEETTIEQLEGDIERLKEALRAIDRETQDSEVALMARRALAHEEENVSDAFGPRNVDPDAYDNYGEGADE